MTFRCLSDRFSSNYLQGRISISVSMINVNSTTVFFFSFGHRLTTKPYRWNSFSFYRSLIVNSRCFFVEANFFRNFSLRSVFVLQFNLNSAKICYQCDELNPSGKFKIIGEKITKCNGVPFEKFATKTSKAFGAAVLTCFTVRRDHFHLQLIRVDFLEI